jgi:hypothetical protein
MGGAVPPRTKRSSCGRAPLPFSQTTGRWGPAQLDVDRGVECLGVVDDAGGERAGVCRVGVLRGQGDGERGDGVARLERRRRDGVGVFVVFAVVDRVATASDPPELGEKVAGVGERARRVSL